MPSFRTLFCALVQLSCSSLYDLDLISDVNKDSCHKDQDLTFKDKDKDLTSRIRTSTRTLVIAIAVG